MVDFRGQQKFYTDPILYTPENKRAGNHITLRIQVCPTEGITPTFLV